MILLHIMVWCGTRLFSYVDVVRDKDDNVKAVTFSNDEKYIDEVAKILEEK